MLLRPEGACYTVSASVSQEDPKHATNAGPRQDPSGLLIATITLLNIVLTAGSLLLISITGLLTGTIRMPMIIASAYISTR